MIEEPKTLRNAEIWACKVFSSTTSPGHTASNNAAFETGSFGHRSKASNRSKKRPLISRRPSGPSRHRSRRLSRYGPNVKSILPPRLQESVAQGRRDCTASIFQDSSGPPLGLSARDVSLCRATKLGDGAGHGSARANLHPTDTQVGMAKG